MGSPLDAIRSWGQDLAGASGTVLEDGAEGAATGIEWSIGGAFSVLNGAYQLGNAIFGLTHPGSQSATVDLVNSASQGAITAIGNVISELELWMLPQFEQIEADIGGGGGVSAALQSEIDGMDAELDILLKSPLSIWWHNPLFGGVLYDDEAVYPVTGDQGDLTGVELSSRLPGEDAVAWLTRVLPSYWSINWGGALGPKDGRPDYVYGYTSARPAEGRTFGSYFWYPWDALGQLVSPAIAPAASGTSWGKLWRIVDGSSAPADWAVLDGLDLSGLSAEKDSVSYLSGLTSAWTFAEAWPGGPVVATEAGGGGAIAVSLFSRGSFEWDRHARYLPSSGAPRRSIPGDMADVLVLAAIPGDGHVDASQDS